MVNESHLHAGHHHEGSGHHGAFDGTGETHFRVRVVSAAFAGRSRLERHRAVNALLAEELATGVHALAIEAAAPASPRGSEEPGRRGGAALRPVSRPGKADRRRPVSVRSPDGA